MNENIVKVGIISCSGEEIPEGTISRLATRRVLELLHPGKTVTLCLPLFLAGGEEERAFARQHPTISVDGCKKLCAKKGTEKYSAPVSASIVVSEIAGDICSKCHRSIKEKTDTDREAVKLVSEIIAKEVDRILESCTDTDYAEESGKGSCACSRPLPIGEIKINGKTIQIAGLPLIFEQFVQSGIPADETAGNRLLEVASIYYPIEPEDESTYKDALVSAYKEYGRTK